jgi:hypothetical protein
VSPTLWLKADDPEPTVPVTVSGEVPAGVPATDVVVPLLLPAPGSTTFHSSCNLRCHGQNRLYMNQPIAPYLPLDREGPLIAGF